MIMNKNLLKVRRSLLYLAVQNPHHQLAPTAADLACSQYPVEMSRTCQFNQMQ
jgi:hypothetical protein